MRKLSLLLVMIAASGCYEPVAPDCHWRYTKYRAEVTLTREQKQVTVDAVPVDSVYECNKPEWWRTA